MRAQSVHACMHACMCVCIHACMHVCMYVCMHVARALCGISHESSVGRLVGQSASSSHEGLEAISPELACQQAETVESTHAPAPVLLSWLFVSGACVETPFCGSCGPPTWVENEMGASVFST